MTETAEQKAKRILDMQCPSTKAALTRSKDEDVRWQHRPNPTNWLAVPDAKNMDEAIGSRVLTFQEAAVETALRQARGKYISQMRGEDKPMGIPAEKRNAAIAAFMFVKIKFVDLMKACGLATEKEVEFAKKDER